MIRISKILILFVIVFCSCVNTSDSEKEKGEVVQLSKWTIAKNKNERQIGKKIDISLLPYDIKSGYAQAVLVYSLNDCSTCLDRSIELLCKVSNIIDNKVAVVAMDSIQTHQLCTIKQIIDPNEELKRKLRLFITPTIIIFDNGYVVNLISIITEMEDQTIYLSETEEFLNYLLRIGY